MNYRRVTFLELKLTNADKFNRIIHSPPFIKETLYDQYWHLTIRPDCESTCFVFIEPLEDGRKNIFDSADFFKKLGTVFHIFVKNSEGKDIKPIQNFSALFQKFKKSSLRGTIIITVEMTCEYQMDHKFEMNRDSQKRNEFVECHSTSRDSIINNKYVEHEYYEYDENEYEEYDENEYEEYEENDEEYEMIYKNEMNHKNEMKYKSEMDCKSEIDYKIEMNDKNEMKNILEYIEPLSKDITITQQLSNPERVDAILGPILDVKFNVKGHSLFVNSKVLSKISPYWKKCFDNQQSNKDSERHYNCYEEYNIEDFEYNSVLHMIQVAYTNDSSIGVQPEKKSDTWDLIILADKYQIRGLRSLEPKGLLNDIDIENSAELYFGYSWRLPSLKNKLEKFIVANFQKIIKTEAYNNILKNHEKYPKFLDMYGEILVALYR
ncbi:6901_t:CDS:2 [Diversispora eburnea]|uniref:6901_t:CDS:1 n=1 Tax=Diversispora eburnea TaxID=1213867 RepID=A0A9N8UY02_9GLOM|nr:6901_t:CDS:2 [Diversispora eburnea]